MPYLEWIDGNYLGHIQNDFVLIEWLFFFFFFTVMIMLTPSELSYLDMFVCHGTVSTRVAYDMILEISVLVCRYTRNLVDEGNGKFNLMLLCWGEGHSSAVHDHADAHCFMKMLDGSLNEIRFAWPEDSNGSTCTATERDGEPQQLEAIGSSLLETNGVCYINGKQTDLLTERHDDLFPLRTSLIKRKIDLCRRRPRVFLILDNKFCFHRLEPDEGYKKGGGGWLLWATRGYLFCPVSKTRTHVSVVEIKKFSLRQSA